MLAAIVVLLSLILFMQFVIVGALGNLKDAIKQLGVNVIFPGRGSN